MLILNSNRCARKLQGLVVNSFNFTFKNNTPPLQKKNKSMQRKEACEELLRVKIKRLQKESLCQRGRVEGN